MRRVVNVFVVMGVLAGVLHSAGNGPAYSGKEWGAPGGDWASTRYSTLAELDTANVKTLGGAWVVDLPERQSSKAPLLVKDGRMFVTTTAGQILALDPATGKSLWAFKPDTPFGGSRGIGIGDGLLFAGLRDSTVIAISQQTGEVVWRHQREAGIPAQGISTAPAYGNGVVVAVVSGGDNFARGRAFGLDAKTGSHLWNFEVVPGPGEKGHETWPADSDIWKYGGGAIWTSPSVDADLGLVYPSDYVLVMSRVAFIPKNAKRPNAAKLFMDYLLSARAQTIMANQAMLFSLRDDVEGPYSAPALAKELGSRLKPIPVDMSLLTALAPAKRLATMRRWQETARAQ